ncbi:hypothetical protein J2T13_005253, partial [Paenibacillus sp. DS2015]
MKPAVYVNQNVDHLANPIVDHPGRKKWALVGASV